MTKLEMEDTWYFLAVIDRRKGRGRRQNGIYIISKHKIRCHYSIGFVQILGDKGKRDPM